MSDPHSQLYNVQGAHIQKDFFLASKLWIWWPIKVWPQIQLMRKNLENQKFIKKNEWSTFLLGRQNACGT